MIHTSKQLKDKVRNLSNLERLYKYTRARSRKIVDKPAITRYSIDSKSGQLNIVIIPAGTGMVADPMCRC